MDFGDYVRVVRRRWLLVAITILSCVAGSAVATILATPQYQASVQLLMVEPQSGITGEASNFNLAQRGSSIAAFIATPPMRSAVLAEAGLADTAPVALSASADESDPFLYVSAQSSNPGDAKAALDAIPDVIGPALADLGQLDRADQLEFRVLVPAALPSTPFSPLPMRNLAFGLLLGIVLGLALAFVREALDSAVRDVDNVEESNQLAVLGVIPLENAKDRVPTLTQPDSARTEAYRKVRTQLLFASPEGLPKVLLVTSPNASEGKTSLALNLAVLSRDAGQRVVVVDGDLRRPSVGPTLLTTQGPGLVEAASGTIALDDALKQHSTGLTVLASGDVPKNPSEIVGSPFVATIIRKLADRFDLVIVDAPPTLPVADALQLAALADGVVLSARIGETTQTELRRARESLERARIPMLGIVLIGGIGADNAYGYGYGADKYSYTGRKD